MSSTRPLVLLLVSALSAAAPGCGPKVDFLQQAPGFDFAALAGGRVAVCGVTTAVVPPDSAFSLREPLTEILETRLLEKRPDLKALPARNLYSALGQDRYDSVLDDFEDSGEISPSTLATLDTLMRDEARYIVLARVEHEKLDYDQSSSTDSETGTETRTWTTKLEIRVAFQVYDLQSAHSAWSAKLTGKDDNSSTYEDKDLSNGNFLGNLVSGLVEGILGLSGHDDYPAPPDGNKILSDIFAEFASRLPRPAK